MYIHKPLRITKGNNSHRNGPSLLLVVIIICPVDMIVYARFDEIPSIILQDIKKTKRYGRTDGRTDNVKTVYLPTNTVCGGYKKKEKKWGGGGGVGLVWRVSVDENEELKFL